MKTKELLKFFKALEKKKGFKLKRMKYIDPFFWEAKKKVNISLNLKFEISVYYDLIDIYVNNEYIKSLNTTKKNLLWLLTQKM